MQTLTILAAALAAGILAYWLLDLLLPVSNFKRGGLRFIRFRRYTVTVSRRRRAPIREIEL